MKRAALAAIVAAAAGLLAWAWLGRGDEGPAATVNGVAISREHVDLAVGHARAKAAEEGRPFPSEDSVAYKTLRRQALDLLVYHEELEQEARRLGIHLKTPRPEGEVDDVAFQRASLRGSALYAAIYRRVTRGIRGEARRNAAMARWVAAMRRRYVGKVDYAAEFESE